MTDDEFDVMMKRWCLRNLMDIHQDGQYVRREEFCASEPGWINAFGATNGERGPWIDPSLTSTSSG